ncbi:MAG: hypothetical protein WBO00_11370, partial [Steroidobacteraceae bacterium]
MAVGVESGNEQGDGLLWLALLRDALPPVAAAVGTAAFAPRLIDLLGRVLKFDWWMVMVYRQHANPEMLCENFTGSWRERGLTTYVGGFYVLDPFYIMSQSLDHPEVCR